jgi:uncharacterized protein (DUF486 family)
MTAAWYGHLKFKQWPVWLAIVASWGLAFFEYIFQVPANRIGYEALSLTELKVIQEIITLMVFIFFAIIVFGEVPRWNHFVSLILLVGAVFFAFLNK